MIETLAPSVATGILAILGTLAGTWLSTRSSRQERLAAQIATQAREYRLERLAAGRRVFAPLHIARLKAQEIFARDLAFLDGKILPDAFRRRGLELDPAIFAAIHDTYFESNFYFEGAAAEFQKWSAAAFEALPLRAQILQRALSGDELSESDIERYRIAGEDLISKCHAVCEAIIRACRAR